MEKNKRVITIFYMMDAIAIYGGLERIVANKMNWLANNPNYKIYLITASQNENPIVFALSEKITHIDLRVNFYQQYRFSYPVRLLSKMVRSLKFRLGLSKLIKIYHPDIIIANPNTDINNVCTFANKVNVIVESHNARHYIGERDARSSFINEHFHKRLVEKMLKTIERKADVLVALTHGDARIWNACKRIETIPNITLQYPQTTYNETSKTVVAAGRFVRQKGFDLLIQAWEKVNKKHPDWSLQIYGDGNLYTEYYNQIIRQELAKTVHLNSAIPNLHDIMQRASFFVLSSRYEGFGLVLAEAMMAGIPCVSFDCEFGPSEIITDKKDGLLAKNGDVEDLACKINWMIEHPDKRKEMASNAYENVQRFTPEKIMPRWEKLFNEILA